MRIWPQERGIRAPHVCEWPLTPEQTSVSSLVTRWALLPPVPGAHRLGEDHAGEDSRHPAHAAGINPRPRRAQVRKTCCQARPATTTPVDPPHAEGHRRCTMAPRRRHPSMGLSPSLSSTPSNSGSGKCSNRMAEYADKRAVLSVNRASVDQVALVRLTECGKICLSHTAGRPPSPTTRASEDSSGVFF